MFKRQRRELKLESLRAQMDFLDALRIRHLGWADDTDDPEIARIHMEIITLIQRTWDHYDRLLALQTKAHK